MSSIGSRPTTRTEVGVATEDGRSYFRITSLLKRIHVPYIDLILSGDGPRAAGSVQSISQASNNLKLIITTRRERLRIPGPNVWCIEDLGDDVSIAKERIFSTIYRFDRDSDWFVVGVDPGERTGLAAYMNQLEVESSVFVSLEDAITRITKLIDNAPSLRKVVKIGAGMPSMAFEIARRLDTQYRRKLKIQLVDERGTSSLSFKKDALEETRDQRAARLIAFREGRDYRPS